MQSWRIVGTTITRGLKQVFDADQYEKCTVDEKEITDYACMKCPRGKELEAGLCYNRCKESYAGFASSCMQKCSERYTDTGLHCLKPKAFGRGTGHTTRKRCKNSENVRCEQYGVLWYPRCNELAWKNYKEYLPKEIHSKMEAQLRGKDKKDPQTYIVAFNNAISQVMQDIINPASKNYDEGWAKYAQQKGFAEAMKKYIAKNYDLYKPFGCCVCTPTCPSGMIDIGVSCQKDSYYRGVGTVAEYRAKKRVVPYSE